MLNKTSLALFLSALSLNFSCAEACTGIKLDAVDGSVVHGRTLEFGVKVDVSIALIPRNYQFTGLTPEGAGLSYKSKYAALGAITYDSPILMDGINEKGLAVGTFYFPGFAGYAKITHDNQSKALSPIDFPNWILTQFATLNEVKEGIGNVVIAPTVIKVWGNETPPFHYIVYDREGKSIVIEPIDGKLVVKDNPLGVFTNSPNFDWHMKNLTNYINLTPWNVKPLETHGIVLTPFGQGSGMVGMPGDFTPPSRFVRAAIYSITATPSANASEGVLQAFHILNQFDIPIGFARSKENGIVYSDFTIITTVKDPQSLKYYYRTYDNQDLKMADLNKFNLDNPAIVKFNTAGKQTITDVSGELK